MRRFWVVFSGVILICSTAAAQLEVPENLKDLPWSKAHTLTSLDAHAIAPTIVADKSGLHVIYQELRAIGNATVSYMNSPDLGKTWINRQVLSSAYSMGVGTSLLSDKEVLHAVWCPTERGINGLNYRRSYNGGKLWELEKVLTETERAIYLPKLFSDSGTLYMTWVEKMIQEGGDFSPRSPTVKDLDIQTMTRAEEKRPTMAQTSYTCLVNFMTSTDGGDNWTPKVVVDTVYEDIRVYNFHADGMNLVFNFRQANGVYRQLKSGDAGLVWQKNEITEEEFGQFERPTVVKYQDNYFMIAAKDVENRTVVFLARTDSRAPIARMRNTEEEFYSENIVLYWTGEDDWSDSSKLQYQFQFDQESQSGWTETPSLELLDLDDGSHQLSLFVRDEAGNVSADPLIYRFEIKRPPDTTIITQLPRVISNKTPKIEWTGSDNTTEEKNLTYEYSVDGGQWTDIQGYRVHTLSDLEDGRHAFRVRAIDQAKNVDPTPARIEFVLDTVPPQTTGIKIGEWFPGAEKIPIEISGQDNLTLESRLVYSLGVNQQPGDEFVPLPSLSIIGLGDGEHKVIVKARDEAGNIQPESTVQTFNLQVPPELEIVSAPSSSVPKADFEIICRVKDNSTPPEAVRISYRINSEEWTEPLPGAAFRILRKDLGPGRYKLHVRAFDERNNMTGGGPGQSVEFMIDPGAPPAPKQFSASVNSEGVVELKWQPPSGIPAEGSRYNVYRSASGGFGINPEQLIKHRISSGYTQMVYRDTPPSATGPLPIQYRYGVSLVDGLGREGIVSMSALVEIQPGGATRVVANPARGGGASKAALLMALVFIILLIVVVVFIVMMIRRRREE